MQFPEPILFVQDAQDLQFAESGSKLSKIRKLLSSLSVDELLEITNACDFLQCRTLLDICMALVAVHLKNDYRDEGTPKELAEVSEAQMQAFLEEQKQPEKLLELQRKELPPKLTLAPERKHVQNEEDLLEQLFSAPPPFNRTSV